MRGTWVRRCFTNGSDQRWFAGKKLVRAPRANRRLPDPHSAETSVNNILFNCPNEKRFGSSERMLCALVANVPGVLSKISGQLAGRGFNIESLVVSESEVAEVSRMNIVLNREEETIEQARKQLEDIVDVWAVVDYTEAPIIERDLLLAKVALLKKKTDVSSEQPRVPAFSGTEFLSAHERLQALTQLTTLFNGKVVDIGSDHAIVELCAKRTRIDAFIELLRPFGIIESSRAGAMAMARSPVAGIDVHDLEEATSNEDEEDVALPPS